MSLFINTANTKYEIKAETKKADIIMPVGQHVYNVYRFVLQVHIFTNYIYS